MNKLPLTPLTRFALLICAAIALLPLGSCTSLLTGTVIRPAVDNLQKQQDVLLVCEGAAAYLLMIDSLIESAPTNTGLLLIGTQAYGGSAAALESCGAEEQRIEAISEKAKAYGKRLLTTVVPESSLTNQQELTTVLLRTTRADARPLFWGAYGWLIWIAQQKGSPESMADLIAVEAIMGRLLDIDESVENGGPHLFFGALYGSKPPLLGGDPEKSRFHFRRALEISERSFLLIHTTYAETYCRMTFNQELHDQLLKEVLAFPIESSPDNALTNQIAKRKAEELLKDGFFAE